MTNEKVFAIAIPWMNANLDAVNRLNISVEIQGHVFAARNSFQFFTIPVGYFMGGGCWWIRCLNHFWHRKAQAVCSSGTSVPEKAAAQRFCSPSCG